MGNYFVKEFNRKYSMVKMPTSSLIVDARIIVTLRGLDIYGIDDLKSQINQFIPKERSTVGC